MFVDNKSKIIFQMTVSADVFTGHIREHHDIEITKTPETVTVLNFLVNRIQDLLQELNRVANVKLADYASPQEELR